MFKVMAVCHVQGDDKGLGVRAISHVQGDGRGGGADEGRQPYSK